MKIRQFMDSQPNKKPTYTVPVAICAAVLVFGSLLLAFLMATRDMAPPRKYEVDMSGSVIGIDTTSKIPVLTKEEAKEIEVKDHKKVDYVEPAPKADEENIPAPEPIIVPSTPPTVIEESAPAETKTPKTGEKAPKIEIKSPKVEPIE